MPLPYQVATLLYCFDEQDRVLLLERKRQPNAGLWSPPGGKVEITEGESPYAAACREAQEELGLCFTAKDLHLTGLISEHGYDGAAHWLMFLFEAKPLLNRLPAEHPEGKFGLFKREELDALPLPQTDRERIWPLFWQNRGGFFAAHCQSGKQGNVWTIEERMPRS